MGRWDAWWRGPPRRGAAEGTELEAARRLDLEELLQRCPDLLRQVAALCEEPASSRGRASGDARGGIYQRMRLWSPFFRALCEEEPTAAGPLQRLARTVASCRTVLRSDGARAARLLLGACWIGIVGVASPVLCVVWTLSESGAQPPADPLRHRPALLALAAASVAVPVLLPRRGAGDSAGLRGALRQLSRWHGAQGESPAARGPPRSPEQWEQEERRRSARDAELAVTASDGFVLSLRAGLAGCSALALVAALWPLVGACASCVGLLLVAVPQARFAGYDVKLHVLKMMQPRARGWQNLGPAVLREETSAVMMREQFLEETRLEEERVSQLPADCRLGAIWTLTTTCFFVCAFRSVILWVGVLQGCSRAERDVHEPGCLPTLAAMVCPGFLMVGTVMRFCLAVRGACPAPDSDVEAPRDQGALPRCAQAAACALVSLPPVLLSGLGIWLTTKLLADYSKSPLGDVLSLWRVPEWEEVLVVAAVAALWVALLLFSSALSACIRILSDSGSVTFIGILGAGYLAFEAMMVAMMLGQGARHLPRMMMLVSSVSTAMLSFGGICYIIYATAAFMQEPPFERSAVGHAFLWG